VGSAHGDEPLSGWLLPERFGSGARRKTRPSSVVGPFAVLASLLSLAILVVLADLATRSLETASSGGTSALTWWDLSLAVLEHSLLIAAALVPSWALFRASWPADLGLVRVSWSKALPVAAAAYGMYLVATAVLFAAAGPTERASARALADADAPVLVVGYVLVACVVAPPTEELYFRGFLFGAIRRRLSLGPAIGLAGVVFGLAHGPPLVTMVQLALLGITLCVVYEVTESLLPGVAVHAAHNGLACAAVLSLSAPIAIALTATATALATTGATAAVRVLLAPRTGASRARYPESGGPAGSSSAGSHVRRNL
jgi:membrane protease YdiL (CAAX protease family)